MLILWNCSPSSNWLVKRSRFFGRILFMKTTLKYSSTCFTFTVRKLLNFKGKHFNGGYQCDHYPLDLTVQSPAPTLHTWDMGNPLPSTVLDPLDSGPSPGSPCWWHLVAITGDLFRLVYWALFYRSPPTGTNIWWSLKQLASGRYASDWNTFF